MIKKRYVKKRRVWKVTFELPKAELPEGVEPGSAHLVGEFNDWDRTATPMTHREDGTFHLTLEFEPGRASQFRYLVNGELWCNDWHADAYVIGGFGADNFVVMTPSGNSPA